jgi:general secretion pathway protein H
MSELSNHEQAGFTLLEVLVVLAITAVVFGLSVVSLSVLRSRASPEALGARVVLLLNDVRDHALADMRAEAAVIDMKNKVISSAFDDPVELPAAFKINVTVGQETVSNAERLQVHFLPDGTSSGVDIELSDPSGRATRIETNWLTGLTRQVHAGG